MKTGVYVLVLMLLMLANTAMARGPFEPSGLNRGFDLPLDRPFSEYIARCRAMIEAGRVDLSERNREQVIQANTPFEQLPVSGSGRKGILLIHGLSDSPYQMRDLADHFASRGFLVRTLLLPGHGTVPGDMVEVSWESWVKAAEYGVHRLATRVDELYVGGFSTGGELAVYLGLANKNIKGLVLFAPATGIRTAFAWLSTTVVAPTWLLKQEEQDFARYDSLPSNAVGQVYALTVEVNRLLKEKGALDVPVFVALSDQDITVDSDKTMELFRTRFTSDKNRMIVYTSDPQNHKKDPSGRVRVVDSRIPAQRILSFSHLSLLVRPEDPHYGKNGDYVYSPHLLMRQSDKGVLPSQVYYGELLRAFRKEHYVRRLSWNPYFRDMVADIDRFMDSN